VEAMAREIRYLATGDKNQKNILSRERWPVNS
jgi:hypothetical protein